MRFDARFPPNLTEKWRAPATSAEVRRFAELVQLGAVFTATYPEQTDPRIGDILSTEVLASAAGGRLSRRYFRRWPDPLAPLREAAAALIARLQRQGEHGFYHQGRRVDLSP
jgi:hypothetical protein